MAHKHFAFIVMGSHYNPEKDKATFVTPHRNTYIVSVRDFKEACDMVQHLVNDMEVGAIELCGAFGPEKCLELIELTHHKIAIGYVSHFTEQDPLFAKFFGQ